MAVTSAGCIAALGLLIGALAFAVLAHETWRGIHILRVDQHRKGGGRSFAEVKETIRDRLVNEQADKYREQYVAELRREALIETRLPELKEQ